MWTKYNGFISLRIKVKRFGLPIIIPLTAIEEIAELLMWLKVIVRSSKTKAQLAIALGTIDMVINEIRYIGKTDIVDIDVNDKNDRVKIKISVW